MTLDWSLAVFILLVVAAASSGALFKPGAWYRELRKPNWTPPNWLFGPVWSVLYILIAIAGWLVWREQGAGLAIALWGVQLIVNAAWSGVFFGLHRIGAAFYVLAVLWLSIAAFALAAASIAPVASLLFLPYLVWVSIAGALNWTVWRLNPQRV